MRERGIPLIVDAAHGAYLRFHPALPLAAERTEAAIVTQSTHKTGAALTQASVALFNDKGPIDRFYEIVNQLGFMSTSFSYVILLSASLAALQLELQGTELLTKALEVSAQVRSQINQIGDCTALDRRERSQGFWHSIPCALP